jgi:hypothetical protein
MYGRIKNLIHIVFFQTPHPSVLDVKRKYLVKANKKYRLLLNIPLLFTFIFVYKVMITILYQKVPSDSKFLTKYCTENIETLRKGGLVENKCVKL